MAIHTRKRGRSPSPPRHSNKRVKLSPSKEDINRNSRFSRVKPESSSTNNFNPSSNNESTLPEPRIRSIIRRPSPIHKPPTSPIHFSRRARSPERIQRRQHSPIRIHKSRSPVNMKRRSPSPIRIRKRSPSPIRFRQRSPSPIRIRQRSPSPIRIPQRLPSSQEPAVNREPVKIPIPRVVRHNRARNLVVSVKNPPKEPKSIKVLKLEGVSNNITLSHLIHEFIVEVSTIVGCHRVADYEAQICDGTVFLYLTSEKEYNALLNQEYYIIEGCIINITDPKLIYGHAKYTTPYGTASQYDMRMSPHPMGLFGFRQLPITTTFYVIAVLRELEQEGSITGFRLAFCETRKVSRNFGFVTFLSRINAFKILNKQFNIMGDLVEVKVPTGMPFLISEDRQHLLSNNRCEFSEEIRQSNWLNVNFLNPALPMRPLAFGQSFQPPASVQSVETVQPPEAKPRCMPSNIPKVIKHDTPPASPTLTIGDDYEIDENGVLAVPSTFWLNANAD